MSNLTINRDAADFSFVILRNDAQNPTSNLITYHAKSRRLKSVGCIQTILDMNKITARTMYMVDPSIYFAPDFPEFLLPNTSAGYIPAEQYTPANWASINYQGSTISDINSSGAIPVDLNEDGVVDSYLLRNNNSSVTGFQDDVIKKVITWGIVRKEPGTVSGTPFTGTQEIKPRPREFIALLDKQSSEYVTGFSEDTIINDPMVKSRGTTALIMRVDGQCFDNLVQYNIWSKSNYEVEELTEWFEDFMYRYTGLFREMGIVEMIYKGRVRDDTIVASSTGYHVRSVLYYIRTERTHLKQFLPISRVNLKVNVETLTSTIDSFSDNLDSTLYETILSRWVKNNE